MVQNAQRGALELLSSWSKHTKRRRREHDAEDGNAEGLHGGVVGVEAGRGRGVGSVGQDETGNHGTETPI